MLIMQETLCLHIDAKPTTILGIPNTASSTEVRDMISHIL